MQNGVRSFTVTHFLTMLEAQRAQCVCDTTLQIPSILQEERETPVHVTFHAHLQTKNCEKPVSSLSCLFAAYETTPSRPHLALFTCLFLLMSFLGVAMYCTDRRRPQRVCEELEAALAVYLLHMKQLLWGCWIWLTMQWLRPTTGGDTEPPLCFFRPLFFFLFFLIYEGAQAYKHLSHLARLCALSVASNHSHSEKGKNV